MDDRSAPRGGQKIADVAGGVNVERRKKRLAVLWKLQRLLVRTVAGGVNVDHRKKEGWLFCEALMEAHKERGP